ncbi:MAG: tetratricopeptide repeat protein [Deltaproteobacteria bacterium]|nr:tetratricopeptide repeat protein [Deltaproteobacteria bacterium]
MVTSSNSLRSFLICVSLAVAIFAAMWGVQNHDFVNFDDGKYVTENSHVQNGLTREGVVWGFTTMHFSQWHPVTWLSHMLDCHLYGLDPAGHHISNLLLHTANTLLLFLVLQGMTGRTWPSALVAALFGLHPLHVEPVAWVSGRKDLLSTLFWMLTMGFYLRYVRGPSFGRYFLVLISFVLGLMAKQMLVTLPFVLLLLDYWPLGRFEPGQRAVETNPHAHTDHQKPPVVVLILEKVPLLAIAALASIVAFLAQGRGGALESFEFLPLDVRLINAMVSYVIYMGKTIWPLNLAVFYPHPGSTIPLWQVGTAGLLLVFISVLVIRECRKRPYLPVGWLWYLGTLVPVIQLVQVGDHAMADRYTYIPLIGLFVMIAWGLADVVARWPGTRIVAGTAAVGLILCLSICSQLQARQWENSVTLFEHALDVTADNHVAHTNLGVALARQGELDLAIWHYSQAVTIEPDYVGARLNLASALAERGKLQEAIAHYSEVLRIKPDYADAHFNMGNALIRLCEPEKAILHYTEALRVKPDDPEVLNNLGIALSKQKRLQDAAERFREALRIRPDFAEARHNLNAVLERGSESATLPD